MLLPTSRPTPTTTLLLLLTLALLATLATSQSSTYSPSVDPEYNTYCVEAGINFESMVLTSAARNEERKKIENDYQPMIQKVLDLVKDGYFNKDYSGKVFRMMNEFPVALAAFILFIIVCVMGILLLGWGMYYAVSTNCCKKLHDDNQSKYAENDEKDRSRLIKTHIVVVITMGILVIVIVIIGIIWLIFTGMSLSDIKKFKCSLSGLKSLTIKGDLTNPNAKFIGTEGMNFLIDQYVNAFINLRNNDEGSTLIASNIKAKDLSGKGSSIKSGINALPSDIGNYAYTGLDGGSSVTSPGTKKYFAGLGAFTSEANYFSTLCSNVGSAATTFSTTFSDVKLTAPSVSMKSSMTEYTNRLYKAFTMPFKDLLTISVTDRPNAVTNTTNSVIAMIVIGIVGLVLASLIMCALLSFMYAKREEFRIRRELSAQENNFVVLVSAGRVEDDPASVNEKHSQTPSRRVPQESVRQEDGPERIQVYPSGEPSVNSRLPYANKSVVSGNISNFYNKKHHSVADLAPGVNKSKVNESIYSQNKHVQTNRIQFDDANLPSNIKHVRAETNAQPEDYFPANIDNARSVSDYSAQKKSNAQYKIVDAEKNSIGSKAFSDNKAQTETKENGQESFLMKLLSKRVLMIFFSSLVCFFATFTIILFAYTTASYYVVGGSIVVCEVANGVFTKQGYFEQRIYQNLKSFFTQTERDITNVCLGPESSGDMSQLLAKSENSEQFVMDESLVAAINGVYGLVQFEVNKTAILSSASPSVSPSFSADISTLAAMTQSDTDGSSEDLHTGLTYFNSLACSKDKFYYASTCPAGFAVSDPAAADNQNLGSDFCAEALKIPTSNFATRYQASGTGVCSGASKSDGQRSLAAVSRMMNEYATKTGELKSKTDAVYSPMSSCVADMKASESQISSLSSNKNVRALMDMHKTFGGGLSLIYDCRFMRRGALTLEHSLCFNFYRHFKAASGLSFALGVILLVLTFLSTWGCMNLRKLIKYI